MQENSLSDELPGKPIEGTCLNIIKVIYDKLIVSIIISGEKQHFH